MANLTINCITSITIKEITRAKATNYFLVLLVIHPVSYFISHNYLRCKEKSSPTFQMRELSHKQVIFQEKVISLQSNCLSHYLYCSINESQKGMPFYSVTVIQGRPPQTRPSSQRPTTWFLHGLKMKSKCFLHL